MDLATRFRVSDGESFRLSDVDPSGTEGLSKAEAGPLLEAGVERLIALQERLYAEHHWALLIVLQGMDTSGKDGIVKHVMSGVNPLGCTATSFKAPTRHELDHGYLWRSQVALPRRGHIGIFNRSYYEDVLAVRVRKDALAEENLPPGLVTDQIWQQRFEDIKAHEAYLANNGIVPLKFMLHISKGEQKRRLLARADAPEKQWKFDPVDVADRRFWKDYQHSYDEAVRHTSTDKAPWFVVPADHKWFARLVVASVIIDALEKLDPKFPIISSSERQAMEAARKELLGEGEAE
jgi:PPK2 family polyphosphate:nucleotide phosphotransferase